MIFLRIRCEGKVAGVFLFLPVVKKNRFINYPPTGDTHAQDVTTKVNHAPHTYLPETTPCQFRQRPVAHRLLCSAPYFLLKQTNVHKCIYTHITVTYLSILLLTLFISHLCQTAHVFCLVFDTTNNLTIIVGLPTITCTPPHF